MNIVALLFLCASALSLPVNEPSDSPKEFIQRVLDANPLENDIVLKEEVTNDVNENTSSSDQNKLKEETPTDEVIEKVGTNTNGEPTEVDTEITEEPLKEETILSEEKDKEYVDKVPMEENQDANSQDTTEDKSEQDMAPVVTAEVGDIIFDPLIGETEPQIHAEVMEVSKPILKTEEVINEPILEEQIETINEEQPANNDEPEEITNIEEIIPSTYAMDKSENIPTDTNIQIEGVDQKKPEFFEYKPIIMPDGTQLFVKNTDYNDEPMIRIHIDDQDSMINDGNSDIFQEEIDPNQDYDFGDNLNEEPQETFYEESQISENPFLTPLDTLPLEASLIEGIPMEQNPDDMPIDNDYEDVDYTDERVPFRTEYAPLEVNPSIIIKEEFDSPTRESDIINDETDFMPNAPETFIIEESPDNMPYDPISNINENSENPALGTFENQESFSFEPISDMDENTDMLPFDPISNMDENYENYPFEPISNMEENPENYPYDPMSDMDGNIENLPYEPMSNINQENDVFTPILDMDGNIVPYEENTDMEEYPENPSYNSMPDINVNQENMQFVPLLMNGGQDTYDANVNMDNDEQSYFYPNFYERNDMNPHLFNPFLSMHNVVKGNYQPIKPYSDHPYANEVNFEQDSNDHYQRNWKKDSDIPEYFHYHNGHRMNNYDNDANKEILRNRKPVQNMFRHNFSPIAGQISFNKQYESSDISPAFNKDNSYSFNPQNQPTDLFSLLFFRELLKNLDSPFLPQSNVEFQDNPLRSSGPIIIVIDPNTLEYINGQNDAPVITPNELDMTEEEIKNKVENKNETNDDDEQGNSNDPMKKENGMVATNLPFNPDVPYAPTYHHTQHVHPINYIQPNNQDQYSASEQQQHQQQKQSQDYDNELPSYFRDETTFNPFQPYGNYDDSIYYNRHHDRSTFRNKFMNIGDRHMGYNSNPHYEQRHYSRRQPTNFMEYF